MDDHELVERIDGLVAEERRLSQAHAGDGLSAEDKARLDHLEVQLDQAWDLLRQRRATAARWVATPTWPPSDPAPRWRATCSRQVGERDVISG